MDPMDARLGVCDVLIIGGGPAGSTAAAMLAERGRDVILLEKEAHPRFHIGESLLPHNLDIFERMGIDDTIRELGLLKPGAEIVDDATGKSVLFDFATGVDRRHTHSYHVERAEFDAALFANARKKGARTAERLRVTNVRFPAAGRAEVTAVDSGGHSLSFAPRFVIDASGRDGFLATRMNLREPDKQNDTASIFAHFYGVGHPTDHRAGCVSVHLVEDGWLWIIPLKNGRTSVGFVGTPRAIKGMGGDLRTRLFERIRLARTVAERMRRAELASEVMGAANYAYRTRRAWGDGYLMIGDAFGFLDPMFSSGVLFAMTGAELAAKVADVWLDDPGAGRALARREERCIRDAMDRLEWFVHRINDPVLRFMLLAPQNRFRMRDGLVSVLAGHLEQRADLRLPLFAFKSCYHLLRAADRIGLKVLATA